jgi:hypothetical protein
MLLVSLSKTQGDLVIDSQNSFQQNTTLFDLPIIQTIDERVADERGIRPIKKICALSYRLFCY